MTLGSGLARPLSLVQSPLQMPCCLVSTLAMEQTPPTRIMHPGLEHDVTC